MSFINPSSSSSLKNFFSFLKSNPNYRADIDGLRAIACLAVVLYHAFPDYLPGGFIGVDIFFVISGYLISSIPYRHLFNQDDPGKVHIVDFYSRRVRRIFPALILVLVTTFVLGTVLLYPSEFKLVLKHIIGGSTYVSNFILYKEAGDYFDVNSKFKPLLHLWSLGVEEQFYLVFPIFLWVIYKLRLSFVLSLSLFSITSFVINYIAVKHGHVSRAFFMPWTRFWELSLGSVLSYVEFNYAKQIIKVKENKPYKTLLASIARIFNVNPKITKNLIAVVGTLLIILGLSLIDNNGVYPGEKALVPVLGALFIIAAGKDTFINRNLLSNKVMVFLGLISYPLYLCHWPLLSYTFIIEDGNQLSYLRIAVVLLSIIFAIITFLYIEPKLRYGKHGGLKAIGLFVVMVIITAVSTIKYHQYKVDEVLSISEFNKKYYGGLNTPQYYVKGSLTGVSKLLVIGDSFSRQYAPYFDKVIPYEGYFTDGNMCYKNVDPVTCSAGKLNIPKLVFGITNTIENSKAKKVLLAHYYSIYINRYPRNKKDSYLMELKDQLFLFADKYKDKDFYILEQNYQVPNFIQCFYNKKYSYVPNKIIQSLRDGINKCAELDNYQIKNDDNEILIKKINSYLEQVCTLRDNLHFIKMRDITCGTKGCSLFNKNNDPIFSDTEHLSIWGRDIVGPVLLNRMNIKP